MNANEDEKDNADLFSDILSSHSKLSIPSDQCLQNRSRIKRAMENHGSHLMKGFTCSLLKDDISETECRSEDMKEKKFFNDNHVLKRLKSKLFLLVFKKISK